MREMFLAAPTGKVINKIATNSFANASLLKYTPSFNKYHRWVTSLTTHLTAALTVLPQNHLR